MPLEHPQMPDNAPVMCMLIGETLPVQETLLRVLDFGLQCESSLTWRAESLHPFSISILQFPGLQRTNLTRRMVLLSLCTCCKVCMLLSPVTHQTFLCSSFCSVWQLLCLQTYSSWEIDCMKVHHHGAPLRSFPVIPQMYKVRDRVLVYCMRIR